VQPIYYLLKQIAAILHSKSSKINLQLERVQRKIDTVDCGVYAIAFLTDLYHGNDPATYHYVDQKLYAITSLSTSKWYPFHLLLSQRSLLIIKELNIYCKCRLPLASEHLKHPGKDEPTCMVRCWKFIPLFLCNMTLQAAKKTLITSKEMWFCKHKGCEALFDSD